jgi:hypothetical protein
MGASVRGTIAIARLVDREAPAEVYQRERERERERARFSLFHEMVGEVEKAAGRH